MQAISTYWRCSGRFCRSEPESAREFTGASPSITADRRKTRFSNLAVSILSSRGRR